MRDSKHEDPLVLHIIWWWQGRAWAVECGPAGRAVGRQHVDFTCKLWEAVSDLITAQQSDSGNKAPPCLGQLARVSSSAFVLQWNFLLQPFELPKVLMTQRQ